jgi:23S rRNA pseudouridine955/2504/2580 synthase
MFGELQILGSGNLTNHSPCRYLYPVHQEIIFPSNETPKTLENFLKKRFPIGYVRKLLRKNGVRVNGRRFKAGDLIAPGDHLQLYIPFERPPKSSVMAHGFRLELDIIFEDEGALVINKPAGMAVHEGREILKRNTVIGILESRYRSQGIAPQLVHRLDKDTSGVLVVAKSEQAAKELEDCFESEKIDKEYLCLVAGRVQEKEGKIDIPLPGREGKPVRALTRFRVEKRFFETTLLRAWIATGRMHQIRLHFASAGYPIVMDDQHGDFGFNKRFRKLYGLKRQFLHAARLKMEYGGKTHVWVAPLPADLQRTLNALKIVQEKVQQL